MLIGLHSDPHISLSGYGIQTKYLTDHLKKMGHRVMLIPKNALIMTHAVELEGYNYYPPMDQWGNEGVNVFAKKFKPDLIISNLDPWITSYKNINNWVAWSPVDHDPIPPDELGKLKECMLPVALTKYSLKQMQDAGLDPLYCPYGVDTKILYPDKNKRDEFRKKMGLTDEDYLVGMVGVNQFDRKGYGEAFQAFKLFKARHPEAQLYVHTDPMATDIGLDLIAMAKTIGIDPIFPDIWEYREGLDTRSMAYVYNAIDMYLSTTHGEGFGIPIIEAQACGKPVIVTGFMGCPELNPHGLNIKYQKQFDLHKSFIAVPSVEDTLRCLEIAYQDRFNVDPDQLVEFAKQYDFEEVFKLFDKVLERAEELLKAFAHAHKWSPLANTTETGATVPCMLEGCEAGLIVSKDKPNYVKAGVYKHEYNGVRFNIKDNPDSGVWKVVLKELPQNDLESLNLNKDSLCIDIGAQVGVVSTYIAKKFGSKVIAFEPMPDNFENLVKNIASMDVKSLIVAHKKAVFDGQPVNMTRGETNLTGSARVNEEGIEVKSVDLNEVLEPLEKVDCVKIDCEGAEYQILYNLTPENIKKIKALRGEFHFVEGQDPQKLIDYCKEHIPNVNVILSGLTQ